MSDPDELVDLERVTTDPGWHRVRAMFDREWGKSGERYTTALESLLNTTDREAAVQNVQIVVMVRKELAAFFQHVEDRVRTLQHATPAEPSMSRRGVL